MSGLAPVLEAIQKVGTPASVAVASYVGGESVWLGVAAILAYIVLGLAKVFSNHRLKLRSLANEAATIENDRQKALLAHIREMRVLRSNHPPPEETKPLQDEGTTSEGGVG